MATTRYKRHRRRHRTRRHRGGALDCKDFLSNDKLMAATYGREYYKLHARGKQSGQLHSTGERQEFETLDEFSKYGIMEWYSKQLEKKEEVWERVTNMEEVKILGVFFHRFKIVLEKLLKMLKCMKLGKLFFTPSGLPLSPIATKRAIDKFDAILAREESKSVYRNDIKEMFSDMLQGRRDLNTITQTMYKIEDAMNKVQCLLYQIMKNEALPDGFVMDKRIAQLARTPIQISSHKDEDIPPLHLKYEYCVGWLRFLQEFETNYGVAPLTFGTTFAK